MFLSPCKESLLGAVTCSISSHNSTPVFLAEALWCPKYYVALHSQSSFNVVECCFKDYFGDSIETINMPLIIDSLPALLFRQAENLQWNKFCLDIQIQTTFVFHKSCISRSDLRVCFSVFSPQQYPQPGSWGRTATGQAYLILPLNNLLASSWLCLVISWAGYCLWFNNPHWFSLSLTCPSLSWDNLLPWENSCHHLCSGHWAGTCEVCSPKI